MASDLPEAEAYGVGMVFLPPDPAQRQRCEQLFEEIVAAEGCRLLGWRTVPTHDESLGDTARRAEPMMRQVFIERDPKLADAMAFERKLYVIRKLAENRIRYSGTAGQRPVLHRQPVLQDDGLQGHADDGAGRAVLSRSRRSVDGERAGSGPLPIQHEHLPELGQSAPVSVRGAQRRDQHAARQHQLDARPAGDVRVRPVRRRSPEAAPDPARGRQRLAGVRQLPGVPGAERPLSAARRDDDGSRRRGRTTRGCRTITGPSTSITAR